MCHPRLSAEVKVESNSISGEWADEQVELRCCDPVTMEISEEFFCRFHNLSYGVKNRDHLARKAWLELC
jgi:hypothetical protein